MLLPLNILFHVHHQKKSVENSIFNHNYWYLVYQHFLPQPQIQPLKTQVSERARAPNFLDSESAHIFMSGNEKIVCIAICLRLTPCFHKFPGLLF